MTYSKVQYDEYIVEYCSKCHHEVGYHYDVPKDVFYNGKYIYTAEGCMVLSGDRKLKGDNNFLRCECLHSE